MPEGVFKGVLGEISERIPGKIPEGILGLNLKKKIFVDIPGGILGEISGGI